MLYIPFNDNDTTVIELTDSVEAFIYFHTPLTLYQITLLGTVLTEIADPKYFIELLDLWGKLKK